MDFLAEMDRPIVYLDTYGVSTLGTHFFEQYLTENELVPFETFYGEFMEWYEERGGDQELLLFPRDYQYKEYIGYCKECERFLTVDDMEKQGDRSFYWYKCKNCGADDIGTIIKFDYDF